MKTAPRFHRRTGIRVAYFTLALVALVFVDCFNATHSSGWTDLGKAPHLAATIRQAPPQSAETPSTPTPFRSLRPPPRAFALALFVFMGVVLDLTRRRVRSRSSPPVLGRSPPALLSVAILG